MNSPEAAGDQPVEVALEAGKTYAWCQCGLSTNQPYCDGKHKGSGFEPKIFKVETPRKVWLCICKKTNSTPYCDGSHAKP